MDTLLSGYQQFTEEKIDLLYEFGQFEFDCGSYGGAADMLYHFRVLVCLDIVQVELVLIPCNSLPMMKSVSLPCGVRWLLRSLPVTGKVLWKRCKSCVK